VIKRRRIYKPGPVPRRPRCRPTLPRATKSTHRSAGEVVIIHLVARSPLRSSGQPAPSSRPLGPRRCGSLYGEPPHSGLRPLARRFLSEIVGTMAIRTGTWAGTRVLLGLARGEACRAVVVADDAVGSYPTLSPFPSPMAPAISPADGAPARPAVPRTPTLGEGSLLSVALSVVAKRLFDAS